MVLAWLKSEIASPRFGTDLKGALNELGASIDLITRADINNEDENNIRFKVLRHYRKWIDFDIESYTWKLITLNQSEVGELQYIDYSYWNELSNHTRLVKAAVENVKTGQQVFDVPNDNFYSIAAGFENDQTFEPIVVITKHGINEIIEGHARATGYALATHTPNPLQVIIGTSR